MTGTTVPTTTDERERDDEYARERIWQVVHSIPRGKVTSYGRVAAMAGLPRAARLVGRVLSQLPKDSKLPWHRVINASGRITFPEGSAAFKRQRTRLVEEGVAIRGSRIDIKQHGWDW
jgi:methylated-DNA-protein-cysteine methyltransferase-like protein